MIVRRDCRWSLYYGGSWYCKLPAVREARTPPKPIATGCPDGCRDLNSVPWKRDLYPDDYPDDVPSEMEGKDSE